MTSAKIHRYLRQDRCHEGEAVVALGFDARCQGSGEIDVKVFRIPVHSATLCGGLIVAAT